MALGIPLQHFLQDNKLSSSQPLKKSPSKVLSFLRPGGLRPTAVSSGSSNPVSHPFSYYRGPNRLYNPFLNTVTQDHE